MNRSHQPSSCAMGSRFQFPSAIPVSMHTRIQSYHSVVLYFSPDISMQGMEFSFTFNKNTFSTKHTDCRSSSHDAPPPIGSNEVSNRCSRYWPDARTAPDPAQSHRAARPREHGSRRPPNVHGDLLALAGSDKPGDTQWKRGYQSKNLRVPIYEFRTLI